MKDFMKPLKKSFITIIAIAVNMNSFLRKLISKNITRNNIRTYELQQRNYDFYSLVFMFIYVIKLLWILLCLFFDFFILIVHNSMLIFL